MEESPPKKIARGGGVIFSKTVIVKHSPRDLFTIAVCEKIAPVKKIAVVGAKRRHGQTLEGRFSHRR